MSQRGVSVSVLCCSLLLAIGVAVTGAELQASPIERLSWLAGCWESDDGDRRVEEQWMEPRGGMMVRMSRTVAGGKAIEFESMRIHEGNGRLIFTARPSGQSEVSFESSELNRWRVVFENAAHDFPQRIIYSRQEDGSLLARIEGEEAGKASGVDYLMRRSLCPDGAGR